MEDNSVRFIQTPRGGINLRNIRYFELDGPGLVIAYDRVGNEIHTIRLEGHLAEKAKDILDTLVV